MELRSSVKTLLEVPQPLLCNEFISCYIEVILSHSTGQSNSLE
nr:MAG TPA: hypothetical protein [Caudoviricetes sp.]DAQ14942.1 MAG TPA: hypothetical protein [Caudoviricetes sp.]